MASSNQLTGYLNYSRQLKSAIGCDNRKKSKHLNLSGIWEYVTKTLY